MHRLFSTAQVRTAIQHDIPQSTEYLWLQDGATKGNALHSISLRLSQSMASLTTNESMDLFEGHRLLLC